MPAGLQTWNASGQKTLDTTDKVGRHRSSLDVTATGSGSVAISKAAGEAYYAFMTLTDGGGRGTITITATGFNWSFTSPGQAKIFYGVY